MSGATASGSHVRVPVMICCIRWGGGAKPGKTHVFVTGQLTGDDDVKVRFSGKQCVVDDFGNLCEVPE